MKCKNIIYKLFFLFFIVPNILYSNEKNLVVVIDPGHGGKDEGASYGEIKEKDVVLNIGLKLGKYINDNLPDVTVLYTRNNDSFVPLYKRAALANQHNSDLFISLHANYCDIPSISGTETYILGLHSSLENLDVAKKENAVILFEDDHSEKYEGFDPNSSESYIMFELLQDEFMAQSANFASLVQNQMKSTAKRKNRGVKQSGFLVLRNTGMPSVLVETGFLSNQDESKFLNSEEGQSHIAEAIYKAFCNYKKTIEEKSDFYIAQADTQKAETFDQEKEVVNTDNIYFSLQILATKKNMGTGNRLFKGINEVWYTKTGNTYKYYSGKELNLSKIKELKTKLQKRFPDSFMVAFKNEKQIPINEALKLIQSDQTK